jgi:hypothetical protein
MIQVHITSTGKSFSPRDKWRAFSSETFYFANIAEVKRWLNERYGNSTRHAQYTERKDGTSYRSGWVIGFRNADWSHSPVQKWLQQDWITVREVRPVEL